jgi:hypothetical protein
MASGQRASRLSFDLAIVSMFERQSRSSTMPCSTPIVTRYLTQDLPQEPTRQQHPVFHLPYPRNSRVLADPAGVKRDSRDFQHTPPFFSPFYNSHLGPLSLKSNEPADASPRRPARWQHRASRTRQAADRKKLAIVTRRTGLALCDRRRGESTGKKNLRGSQPPHGPSSVGVCTSRMGAMSFPSQWEADRSRRPSDSTRFVLPSAALDPISIP